jgi:Protein of unknown function (DUF3485)
MKKSRFLFAFVACILLGGVVLQFLRIRNIKDGETGGGIAAGELIKRLPMSVGGWEGRVEPLGPSEFVSEQTEKILNFDDYAYVTYRNGKKSLGVYVAYWRAGRMPTHKVASHTPDRCWTENGWKCEEMKFAVPISYGKSELKPAQWRRFTPPSGVGTQYVLFWHLVGDELYDYGDRFNSTPHPLKWWRDSMAYALKGSQPQYFIRLTSDQPVEEIINDPDLAPVLDALAGMGLRLPPGGVSAAATASSP